MMLAERSRSYEFPLKITDLSSGWRSLYSKAKIFLREQTYSIHPSVDFLMEVVEFVSIIKIFNWLKLLHISNFTIKKIFLKFYLASCQ